MKILSLGSRFFNDSFRRSGIDVCAVVPLSMTAHTDDISYDFYANPEKCEDFISEIINRFKPDLIFQGDHSGPLVHAGIEKYEIPKIWYAVDVHLHYAWYRHYASIFDKVFCAQKNYIDCLSEYSSDVEWLPVFYAGSHRSFTPWNERSHEISFVGTLDNSRNPQRVRLFSELADRNIIVYTATGAYEPIYSQSKIVINQSVANDLNLRFFEAAGCGALLISDRLTHSMNEILIPGEDYLIYEHDNIDSLVEKIRWARENDFKVMNMARRAQKKILDSNCEIHRATRIVQWLSNNAANMKEKKSLTQLSHLAWTYDLCSRLDIPVSVTDFFYNKAAHIAQQINNTEKGLCWPLLILAGHEFTVGQYHNASEFLGQIDDIPDDREYIRQYHVLKLSIDYLNGKIESANAILWQLLQDFPDDPELVQIQKLLMNR